jgi:small subunit ribosomal protein S24e
MEVEVTSRAENVLLGRIELEIRLTHDSKSTPKRDDVQKKVAELESSKSDLVIVRRMAPEFGQGATRGWVRVYKDAETLKRLEAYHILVRHKLAEKKVKAAKEQAPASQSAAPAAPKK